MASSFAVFQCPNSHRPLIAELCTPGAGGLRLSVRVPTAAFFRRKPFRRTIASPAGSTLSIPSVKKKKNCYVVVSAYSVETPPNFLDVLERCFTASTGSGPPSSSLTDTVLSATKKKSYGSRGTVTLEKSKLDLSQKTIETTPELETGGGGGDIGKKNFHGGGDGGDDNGDDDDYFDDFDDGDERDESGWFRRRIVIKEFFDRKFVDAVFSEWFKTMADLPGGLRQACEMGLVSSAQLVRFFTINARPTVSRLIYRSLSSTLSRAFIGRMLADPSFLYKFMLQQVTTIGSTIWWEFKNRRGRMKEEWDLALINVATIATCNAFIVWSLAPCRSYGSTFRFDLQNTIQKLPNNVFEKSYPMRDFDLYKRFHSFFYKAAELCLVGFTAGAIQGFLTNALSSKKEGRLSMTIPSVNNYALSHGAFLGLYANLRYQLLCGIDRALLDHFDVLGIGFLFSSLLRVLNIQIEESFRQAWLGVEANPLAHSDNLLKPYNGSWDVVLAPPSSNWFISRNAIISGLGLIGLRQKSGDLSGAHSKPRRKRVVKKKMSTNLA